MQLKHTISSEPRKRLTAAMLLWLLVCAGSLLGASEYDITATLRYPAGDEGSPQPTGLYVDQASGDIYVVDAVASRIAIFDAQRRFNFEFSTRDRLVSPRLCVVDDQGRIYVVGDSRAHTLAVFDFDGQFLRYLDLRVNDLLISPAGLVLRGEELFVLSTEPLMVHVVSLDGTPLRNFALLTEADEETQNTPIVGNFSVLDSELLLPLPIFGQVARMDLSGKLLSFIGFHGGGPGGLSFPIACCPTDDGGFVVLDKHRHLLQFIGSNNIYTQEIGGAGLEEGWFFHPSSLVRCKDGVLLVGQTTKNLVQTVIPRVTPVVSGS